MLKPRQRLGKYRIERRIAEGGFAEVYRAYDTVEGITVALKLPHTELLDRKTLDAFRREVRITASLDHPSILPIKNADEIDGRFVIASRLGVGTLDDLMVRRVPIRRFVPLADQMLAALAHAHAHDVIHCDVKPSNFILFDNEVLRLADFGIAKIVVETVRTTGSGTLGYMAPEHALGRPGKRSDCFSLALVFYRMLSGELPRWPFRWPLPGHEELRRRVPRPMVDFLRRALEVDERKRFADAVVMQGAFRRIRSRVLGQATRRRKRSQKQTEPRWEAVREREFRRRYGSALRLSERCTHCDGPVSEAMIACPWCGEERPVHRGETDLPRRCPRCRRGVKSDWRFCPWCYGGRIGPCTDREYDDRRYTGRCANPKCDRKVLMPFMRYCPWCNRKVRKGWALEQRGRRCKRCGNGIASDYWAVCPWCARTID